MNASTTHLLRSRLSLVVGALTIAPAACSAFESTVEPQRAPDAGTDSSGVPDATQDFEAGVDSGDAAPPTSSEAYRATVLADAPIAYWRFAEAAGAPGLTSDVNGHVLLKAPVAPTSGFAGLFSGTGGAVGYTGLAGERLISSTVPLILPNAFAFETWIYLPNKPDGSIRSIAVQSNGASSWHLYFYDVSLYYEVAATNSDVTTLYWITAPTLSATEWHHVVAQGASPAAIHISIDGIKYESLTSTNQEVPSARDLTVGAASPAANPVAAGTKLTEVALYDHVLTDARVTAHYLAGKAP